MDLGLSIQLAFHNPFCLVWGNFFFIEIGRQGDHHVGGETYFWELDEVGAPNYEIGYFTLFF